jgi:hypothetical protein
VKTFSQKVLEEKEEPHASDRQPSHRKGRNIEGSKAEKWQAEKFTHYRV